MKTSSDYGAKPMSPSIRPQVDARLTAHIQLGWVHRQLFSSFDEITEHHRVGSAWMPWRYQPRTPIVIHLMTPSVASCGTGYPVPNRTPRSDSVIHTSRWATSLDQNVFHRQVFPKGAFAPPFYWEPATDLAVLPPRSQLPTLFRPFDALARRG